MTYLGVPHEVSVDIPASLAPFLRRNTTVARLIPPPLRPCQKLFLLLSQRLVIPSKPSTVEGNKDCDVVVVVVVFVDICQYKQRMQPLLLWIS